MNNTFTSIQEHGYVYISGPFESSLTLSLLNDSFLKILENYQERIRIPSYIKEEIGLDPDDALVIRSNDTGHDEKAYFHYRPVVGRYLSLHLRRSPMMDNFLGLCDDVYHKMLHFYDQIYMDLDEDLSQIYEKFRSAARKEMLVLRLLRYKDVSKEQEILAMPHQDISCLTSPLYESHSGLQLLIGENWQNVKMKEGSTLIFPGMKMGLLTGGMPFTRGVFVEEKKKEQDFVSQGAIAPAEHRVLGVPGKKKYTRTSIVFFAHVDMDA